MTSQQHLEHALIYRALRLLYDTEVPCTEQRRQTLRRLLLHHGNLALAGVHHNEGDS